MEFVDDEGKTIGLETVGQDDILCKSFITVTWKHEEGLPQYYVSSKSEATTKQYIQAYL